MKKIGAGKGKFMELFDEEDSLCPKCNYPLDSLDYPNSCLSCNAIKKLARESKKDSFLREIYPYPFEKIICVGEYHVPKVYRGNSKNSKYMLSKCILHYKKYPNNIDPFSDLLKEPIENLILKEGLDKKKIIICGVPDLESEKHQKAELLCEAISEKTNIAQIPFLKKIKEIPKQHKTEGLKGKYENVHGAYLINEEHKEKIKGKIIFLIDDIISTMATVNECAKELKKHHPKKINVFSLGRNILPPRKEDKK